VTIRDNGRNSEVERSGGSETEVREVVKEWSGDD
jgi:hypothetical protein